MPGGGRSHLAQVEMPAAASATMAGVPPVPVPAPHRALAASAAMSGVPPVPAQAQPSGGGRPQCPAGKLLASPELPLARTLPAELEAWEAALTRRVPEVLEAMNLAASEARVPLAAARARALQRRLCSDCERRGSLLRMSRAPRARARASRPTNA